MNVNCEAGGGWSAKLSESVPQREVPDTAYLTSTSRTVMILEIGGGDVRLLIAVFTVAKTRDPALRREGDSEGTRQLRGHGFRRASAEAPRAGLARNRVS